MEEKELKVGAKVLVYGSSLIREHIDTIDGETKTCWKVGNTLYNKDTLAERGGSTWNRTLIRIPSDEDLARIIKANRVAKIYNFFNERQNIESLSDEQLRNLSIFINDNKK